MHLSILEDYVSELSLITLDDPNSRIDVSEVRDALWEIILIEERLIPDFVLDGDVLSVGLHQSNERANIRSMGDTEPKEDGKVKKLLWMAATTVIGVSCFLFGFFTAP